MSYPSHCCQKCGDQIGWLGRVFGSVFHTCKKEEEKEKKEDFPLGLYKYFCGMIEVACVKEGGLSGVLTDHGEEKLKAFTLDELILYFNTFFDAYSTEIILNIYGRGPMSLSRDAFAFQVLMHSIAIAIHEKRKQEKGIVTEPAGIETVQIVGATQKESQVQ